VSDKIPCPYHTHTKAQAHTLSHTLTLTLSLSLPHTLCLTLSLTHTISAYSQAGPDSPHGGGRKGGGGGGGGRGGGSVSPDPRGGRGGQGGAPQGQERPASGGQARPGSSKRLGAREWSAISADSQVDTPFNPQPSPPRPPNPHPLSRNDLGGLHVETLIIHKLCFNQSDYTFPSVLLMNIALCSRFHRTKLMNYECFDVKFAGRAGLAAR